MHKSCLLISCILTAKELARNRFALILLLVIPLLFFTLVRLTTTEQLWSFQLASVSEDLLIEVSGRKESLIFVGIAAVGLLSSFLALNLIQKNAEVNRRLILCGFKAWKLLCAKMSVLLLAVLLIASYVAALLLLFFRPEHLLALIGSFFLAGFVHACYGLFVGAAVRRELEGILLIVLLVNIDAGWLQNPIYYTEAQNQMLIRRLPAYFPSQAAILSAFTSHSILGPMIGSLAYGAVLLAVAVLIFSRRMRIHKSIREEDAGQLGIAASLTKYSKSSRNIESRTRNFES
jgi:hypothetical protein